jgi:hypothetical protein
MNERYVKAYMRGCIDASKRRSRYRGSCVSTLPVGFTVLVPGCAFTDPAAQGYRDGWLDSHSKLS